MFLDKLTTLKHQNTKIYELFDFVRQAVETDLFEMLESDRLVLMEGEIANKS